MRLLKQLVVVFAVIGLLGAGLMLLSMDLVKVEWLSFMEVQPSFKAAEKPLPLPARSVPVEGPAYIVDAAGAPIPPENPVSADAGSVARGATLFDINCKMCHGPSGVGDGPIGALFTTKKPADLTSALVQDQADGDVFLTLTNGKNFMPYFIENLSVRDRWDVVNFIRTLKPAQ